MIKDRIVALHVINQNYSVLTPTFQKVARYVLNSPGVVLTQTAAQIAQNSGTSEATVIRFCREVGYKGFHDFQIALARDLGADNDMPVPENIFRHDDPWQVFNKIIASEIENLNLTSSYIDKEIFTSIVHEIAKTNTIGFYAVGSSYPVAFDAFWKFSKIGFMCHSDLDSGKQMISAQSLKNVDIAFAVSRSGFSKTTIEAVRIAKENGAKTICLTQGIKSELAKLCDISLITNNSSFRIHDVATSSRIVHMSIMDAIYSAVTVLKWDEASRVIKRRSEQIRKVQF